MEMQYRHLGRSGLRVSVLSFGSWVSFGPQLAGDSARDCLAAAYDAGVNFFDNAEGYAGGRGETIMGGAIAALGWPPPPLCRAGRNFLRHRGGIGGGEVRDDQGRPHRRARLPPPHLRHLEQVLLG